MRYEADMALIRHGMTPGNEEHRYIGRTDEPLSQKGREQLLTLQKKGVYPAAACVAASPLERCRQTAELLYPGQAPCVFDQFREMDFGAFAVITITSAQMRKDIKDDCLWNLMQREIL